MIRCPIFIVNNEVFGFTGIDFSDLQSKENLEKTLDLLKKETLEIAKIYTELISD
jgi:hypothetical protein